MLGFLTIWLHTHAVPFIIGSVVGSADASVRWTIAPPGCPISDGPHCGPFFHWGLPLHLLYLDESGHPDDPNSSFFVLAGFAIFERQTYWLEQQLDAIVGRFTAFEPNATELHGSEMYGGKNAWRGITPEARSQAVVDILSLLADQRLNLRIFASVIEKSQMASHAILHKSFENVVTAFDAYLYSLYRKRDPQRGLVIFDKSNYEQQLQALSHLFRRDGHQTGKLRNLAEVPLFLDSKASRLIQMADIIAYWIFRYFQSGDSRGFEVIRRFCTDLENAPHGLVTALSAETIERLSNIQPHKHPFPPTTILAFATGTGPAANSVRATPPTPAPNPRRYRAHPRALRPREAAPR